MKVIVRTTEGSIIKGEGRFGTKWVIVEKEKVSYGVIASIWFPDQQHDRSVRNPSIPDDWRLV